VIALQRYGLVSGHPKILTHLEGTFKRDNYMCVVSENEANASAPIGRRH